MTGKEMLLQVLLSLQNYLEIVDDDLTDKLKIDCQVNDSIIQMRNHALPRVFDDFVRYLAVLFLENRDSFLEDPYPDEGTIHVLDFSLPNFEKKNRGFSYSDPDFSFFSLKALLNGEMLTDFSRPDNGLIWKQLQTFFERAHNPVQNHIRIFFDCLNNNDISKGFIVKRNPDAFDVERHYSYIYLSFLNSSHSVPLPGILNYSTPALNPVLNFSGNVEYEQYFDVYDVLNELNQAPDLLSRFMKLYHVMEYLMYRVYLVDLVARVGGNKFFVREFINSSERMKKSEKETFIKNFSKIFQSDKAYIKQRLNAHVNLAINTFLDNHGLVADFSLDNVSKVSELIYGIRCAIVHNKESEYHLTVSFYDDFIQIIPLIKELTGTMEELLIEKIKTNHVNIKYPQRQVNLY